MKKDYINKMKKKIRKVKKINYSSLSKKEVRQLAKYLYIFKKKNFLKHWEVNKYITKKKKWEKFKALRSYNDHGYNKEIKGIMPKYFAIVSKIIKNREYKGEKLINARRY